MHRLRIIDIAITVAVIVALLLNRRLRQQHPLFSTVMLVLMAIITIGQFAVLFLL